MQISRQTQELFQSKMNLSDGITKAELEQVVQEMDTDGDGQLSAQEAQQAGVAESDVDILNQTLRQSASFASSQLVFPIPGVGEPDPPAPIPSVAPLQNTPPMEALPGVSGPARNISDAEMEKMLNNYNTHLASAMDAAPEGSNLRKYQAAMRLLSMLENPELLNDPQARDALEMRRYKIDEIRAEYERLGQTDEVKNAYNAAKSTALNDTFGGQQGQRARAFANHLRSPAFLQTLKNLPPQQAQAKLQGELAKLGALNPDLAQEVSGQILQLTIGDSALSALTGEDDAAAQDAQNGVAEALKTYLKVQQTSAGVTSKVDELRFLRNMPDSEIQDISQSLARIARNVRTDDLKDNDKLARALLEKLDEFTDPQEKLKAQKLITHMRTQGVLNTVLLAGSIAGIGLGGIPQDAESWAGLASSGLDVVSNTHHAFKMLGMNRTADILKKVNWTPVARAANAAGEAAEAGRVVAKFPIIGLVASGAGLASDMMAFRREGRNEDIVGQATRAAGIASGVASIAAVTVMSGPAAPITLIAATTVGVGAWIVDSTMGESELTGQVRQDLRALGISTQEETTTRDLTTNAHTRRVRGRDVTTRTGVSDNEILRRAANASLNERVALINQYMDERWTDGDQETLITNVLRNTPDGEFLSLMEMIDTSKLANELENDTQATAIFNRLASAYKARDGKASGPKLNDFVRRLAQDHREDLLRPLLRRNPEVRDNLPGDVIKQMTVNLMDGATDGTEETAISSLLSQTTEAQIDQIASEADGKYFERLKDELETYQLANVMTRMLRSSNPATREKALDFMREIKEPRTVKPRRGKSYTVYDGMSQAAEVARRVFSSLSNAELAALPRKMVESMGKDLKTHYDSRWTSESSMAAQISRLERLGYKLD